MIKELYDEIIKILHSDHPFAVMIHDIAHWISYLWHYKVFATADKRPILVSNIVIGIILFLIGLRIAKYLSLALKRKLARSLDIGVATSLERVSHYLFILLIGVFVLDVTDVPLTAFTVVGTTLALGVGLGSQNIANNFISGLIIMMEQPIKLGDIIEVRNIVGKVTNIGARCISVQTENNINMLIPNSHILQDAVINWTLEDTTLKAVLEIQIDNDCKIEQVDEVILKTLKANPHILRDPAPQILLKDISKDEYDFEVEFWIDLASSSRSKYIINDINRALAPLFKEHNITIAKNDLSKLLKKKSKTKNENPEEGNRFLK